MGPMLFKKQQNHQKAYDYHENQITSYDNQQKEEEKILSNNGNVEKFQLKNFKLKNSSVAKILFDKKAEKFQNSKKPIKSNRNNSKKCSLVIEKIISNSYVIEKSDNNVMTKICNSPKPINCRPRWRKTKISYTSTSDRLSSTTLIPNESILPSSNLNLSLDPCVRKEKRKSVLRLNPFKGFKIVKSLFKSSHRTYTTSIREIRTTTKYEKTNVLPITDGLAKVTTTEKVRDTLNEVLSKEVDFGESNCITMFQTNDYQSMKTSKSSRYVNSITPITSHDTYKLSDTISYSTELLHSDNNSENCCNHDHRVNKSMTYSNVRDNDQLKCSDNDNYQIHRRRGRLRSDHVNNNNMNKNITNNTETNTNNSFNKNINYNNNKNNNSNINYNNSQNIFIDYYNKTLNLLLLLSSLTPILSASKSLMKFRRYVTLPSKLLLNSTSKLRITSPILWMIGLAIAITILPINLVNATSHSEEQYDLEISYNDNVSYMNGTNATVQRKTPLFPKDLFTPEQLENGAVVLHILGVIYMFVALAIVCDEFFVPSLDVIIEKLGITDDVAGATFMAAGGSAPELFTSVIGVFVSFDDVGIGTIVGSAVFNILFVIGMCALFSKTVLTLTWWPLFRDCSFYSVSLLVLIYFFRDNLIYWWEALVLFLVYIAYVGFMKWNQQVERCVKKVIYKNKVTRVRSTDQLMPALLPDQRTMLNDEDYDGQGNAANSSETSMATQPGGSVTSRAASESRSGPPGSSSGATGNSSTNAGSTVTGAKFRHGLLQLMIHTIDPLHDGKVDEKATQLHAIASLKVLLDATKPQRGAATTSAANHVKINLKETTLASDRPNGNIDTTLDSPSVGGRRASWIEQRVKMQARRFSTKGNELEEEPEALSMSWPTTGRKRITYLLVAPIVFPLWLTLPDTRTPRGKKLFAVTFIGSIVWIAAYSYLMVWWANIAGDTAKIPPEVMGLTFLAAGTSIPDLITSVIVARKGFGDMAVSSSVGSNIFDVTVGLPIPWLLYGIIYQQPVEVNSVGMVCSITILFMMLLFVVMSIACFRWRMNKGLGLTMFLLYFVFVAVSLMFEYKIITCPV